MSPTRLWLEPSRPTDSRSKRHWPPPCPPPGSASPPMETAVGRDTNSTAWRLCASIHRRRSCTILNPQRGRCGKARVSFCSPGADVHLAPASPCACRQLFAELDFVEMCVEAAARQQFVVCARFHHDSILQNEDDVRLPDRRQPVRDHDGGFVPRQSVERFEDQFFRSRIKA